MIQITKKFVTTDFARCDSCGGYNSHGIKIDITNNQSHYNIPVILCDHCVQVMNQKMKIDRRKLKCQYM